MGEARIVVRRVTRGGDGPDGPCRSLASGSRCGVRRDASGERGGAYSAACRTTKSVPGGRLRYISA